MKLAALLLILLCASPALAQSNPWDTFEEDYWRTYNEYQRQQSEYERRLYEQQSLEYQRRMLLEQYRQRNQTCYTTRVGNQYVTRCR